VLLSREDIGNFEVRDRVWVEGRRFHGYIVIRPLVALPSGFLDPEFGYGAAWHPPDREAPHGHFVFPQFPCPALTVEEVWSAPDGGWRGWHHSEMLMTQRGIRFAETGWPSDPYLG
jgi:hypothetical protein